MLPKMALCFHAGVHHLGIIRQFAPETLITDHHSFQASTNVYLFGACCNRNSTETQLFGKAIKLCKLRRCCWMARIGGIALELGWDTCMSWYVFMVNLQMPGWKTTSESPEDFSSTRETENAYSSMSRTHHESKSVFLQKSLVFQI